MNTNKKVLVIGAGIIAQEYVKVILAQKAVPIVVSRGKFKAAQLKKLFPAVTVINGGLEKYLKKNRPPEYAIIATQIEDLANSTKLLIKSECKNILVEKPLTYSHDIAEDIDKLSAKFGSRVSIAFNRRAYQSVLKAKELIELDGGVSSFHFDFTEAIFRISPRDYSFETTKYWGIGNSSHVIDTAFYLGGKPERIECFQYRKEVPWHPAGSIFTGIGESMNGVPFTYHANWGAPGKWNIEIMTKKRKLLFSPMERIRQQPLNTFSIEEISIDYSIDTEFKPGFFYQVEAFLKNEGLFCLADLSEDIINLNKIFNY